MKRDRRSRLKIMNCTANTPFAGVKTGQGRGVEDVDAWFGGYVLILNGVKWVIGLGSLSFGAGVTWNLWLVISRLEGCQGG